MRVTNFSIRHHMGVLVLCLGLVILGVVSYILLPRENFPDVRVPWVIVTSVLEGANPTDVETSVTIPLETAIDGTEGMKTLKSNSIEGLSIVTVEFYPEISTETALQRIRDAVDEAKKDLPSDIEEPIVQEFAFSSIPILVYNLIGDETVSRSEMKELAEELEDEIKQIQGVLDVEIYGGREEEVIIEVDPDRLHFYELTIEQVLQVLNGSNRNVSAGAVNLGNNRIVMRVPGEFESPGDIKELVIGLAPNGSPIYLMDVATARFGYAEELSRSRSYDFRANGDENRSLGAYTPPRKSVSLQITKRSGENILRISQEVAAVFARKNLPDAVRVVKGLDQSKDVRMMVSDLENGIATSLVLVLIVIFIGLGLRNAILVSMAIPFSMLMAIIILRFKGETMNMMVLFSLILALGMLVDNAIVIVENIDRHFNMGKGRLTAAMEGTAEVAWPVITSTATTVGAFFPLLFWPDLMGEFMSFLPMTVIIVLLCSLFVALVINPTLCSLLLKRKPGQGQFSDPETHKPTYPAVVFYRKLLEFMLQRPLWTVATTICMMLLTLALFAFLGSGVELFPPQDPKFLTVEVEFPEGASIDERDRLCRAAEDRIFGAPGSGYDKPVENLKSATVTIGVNSQAAANPMQSAGPVNIQLDFVDRDYRTEPTVATLEETRRRIEGLDSSGKQVTYPLFEANYNVIRPQEGPPTGSPVAIDIYGKDLNEMTEVVQDMKRLMSATRGAAKPRDDAATAAPTFEWAVDLQRAGVAALDRGTIGNFLQMSIGGRITGTYGHGDDEQDIRLRIPEEFRTTSERLGDVYVPTRNGGSVPVMSVADPNLVPGPVNIRHYERKRVITAGAELQPGLRNDADIRKAFQQKVKAYTFPTDVTYRFGGAAKEEQDAKEFLLQAFCTAIFIIVMVLVLQFNSLITTGIVLVSVVLSQMGVFIGLLILRMPFGIIMTGIAVISLAGIVVNNAIVLLDAVNKCRERGLDNREAIITASMIRFRPVLLTAITTILGLVPMALKFNIDFGKVFTLNFAQALQLDTESAQWWQGMAVAVIAGLFIATVLTLGVVPVLSLIHGDLSSTVGKAWRRWREGESFGIALEDLVADLWGWVRRSV